MIINQHTSPARRRRITAAALLVAANALVAGASLLAAAPANAISEKQIQAECADAGGQYSSSKGDLGTTFSTCTYFDEDDQAHTDYYADGDYYYSDAPPPPSSKPGPPRLAPNPVLSPVVPSATPKPPGSNLGSPAATKLQAGPTR